MTFFIRISPKLVPLVIGSLMAGSSFAEPPPNPMKAKWSELNGMIGGQKLSLRIAKGTAIEGTVLRVEPAFLVVTVTKTADRKFIAKGQQSIARESVASLKVIRTGNAGRRIGVLVGAGMIGTAGIMATQARGSLELAVASFLLGIAGIATTVVGYFMGRAADRHEIEVLLIPD